MGCWQLLMGLFTYCTGDNLRSFDNWINIGEARLTVSSLVSSTNYAVSKEFTINITIVTVSKRTLNPVNFCALRASQVLSQHCSILREGIQQQITSYKWRQTLSWMGPKVLLKQKACKNPLIMQSFFHEKKNQPHGCKMKKSLARNLHELWKEKKMVATFLSLASMIKSYSEVGSTCSTSLVTHWSWVWIPPGAGLFSSHFYQ